MSRTAFFVLSYNVSKIRSFRPEEIMLDRVTAEEEKRTEACGGSHDLALFMCVYNRGRHAHLQRVLGSPVSVSFTN